MGKRNRDRSPATSTVMINRHKTLTRIWDCTICGYPLQPKFKGSDNWVCERCQFIVSIEPRDQTSRRREFFRHLDERPEPTRKPWVAGTVA